MLDFRLDMASQMEPMTTLFGKETKAFFTASGLRAAVS